MLTRLMAEPELATWAECEGFCGPWEPGQSATAGAGVPHEGCSAHVEVLLVCGELQLSSWDRSRSGGQFLWGEGKCQGQREGLWALCRGPLRPPPGYDDLARGLLGSAFSHTHSDHLSQQKVTEKSWRREMAGAQGGLAQTPSLLPMESHRMSELHSPGGEYETSSRGCSWGPRGRVLTGGWSRGAGARPEPRRTHVVSGNSGNRPEIRVPRCQPRSSLAGRPF